MPDQLSRDISDQFTQLLIKARADSQAVGAGPPQFQAGKAKFEDLIDAIRSTLQNVGESPAENTE